jgi:hypothetical protein
MNNDEAVSERVARWLQRVGLNQPVAFILEAIGPLAFLGAQAAFLMEPLIGASDNPVGDLARLLEDPTQVSELVERLRTEEEVC